MEKHDLVAMEQEMDRREVAAEMHEESIRLQMNLYRASDQEAFIGEHRPTTTDQDLAALFKEIALNWFDEVEIGRRCKCILKNFYREAAEHDVKE